MNKSTIFACIVLILVVAGLGFLNNKATETPSTNDSPDPSVISTVSYLCENTQSMSVSYTEDSASVVLSDGRKLDLAQTISASGTRYGNAEVALVTKGNNAFFQESDVTTYNNCVAHTEDTTTSEFHTFTDGSQTFRFDYTNDVTISGGGTGYTERWMNESQSLGLILAQASLPKSFMPSTNFSEAVFKVATSSNPTAIKECLIAPQGVGAQSGSAMIGGTQFTSFSYSDAGAGNLYETTSYRTVRDKQCYVIEYTVHSTSIGSYTPDQGIKEFDNMKVKNILEAMVQSFNFL